MRLNKLEKITDKRQNGKPTERCICSWWPVICDLRFFAKQKTGFNAPKRRRLPLTSLKLWRRESAVEPETADGDVILPSAIHKTPALTGFTLLEIIIYMGLLSMIVVFIINSLVQVGGTYNRLRAEREVVSNARRLFESVNKTIAESKEVYDPTSRFNQDAGQLSLISAASTTPEHTSSFIDFWIDNGLFMIRREGSQAIILSSPSVRVQKFKVEKIMQGLGRESVKIILGVEYMHPNYAASTTLNSTTALRGSY